MTCIVSPALYPTKKAFKQAVLEGKEVQIEDPSIFRPRCITPYDIAEGEMLCVTNHPKRSWFASMERVKGRLVVK